MITDKDNNSFEISILCYQTSTSTIPFQTQKLSSRYRKIKTNISKLRERIQNRLIHDADIEKMNKQIQKAAGFTEAEKAKIRKIVKRKLEDLLLVHNISE